MVILIRTSQNKKRYQVHIKQEKHDTKNQKTTVVKIKMQANEFTTCIHLHSIPTTHTNYIISTNAHIQGRTQAGSREPGLLDFFFQLLYISFLQLGPPSKTLGSLSLNKPNQPQLNSNYPTQKLNKNNKNIHNSHCILAKKLFYHQRKKMCYWKS